VIDIRKETTAAAIHRAISLRNRLISATYTVGNPLSYSTEHYEEMAQPAYGRLPPGLQWKSENP
jgi:hypothetical protein